MSREVRSLIKYEIFNILRAKWLIGYGLLFAGVTSMLLQFASDSSRAVASLLNLVLLFVPMVSLFYSTAYWYDSEGFTSLLLTQPLRRKSVFLARWGAISLALSTCFIVFSAVPLAAFGALAEGTVLLLLMGAALTLIFVALGLLMAVLVQDRLKGIGFTFVVWLYFAIVHDAIILLVLNSLRDYPIEIPGMILMGLNPIDLARVLVLLSLDLAAMMGYTGRLLQKALSGALGGILVGTTLFAWIVLLLSLGIRRFKKMDL